MKLVDERRELAARVAGQAELSDVQFFRLNGELLRHAARDVQLEFDLATDVRCVAPEDSDALIVEGSYTLEVWQSIAEGDASAPERVVIARIELLLGALFDVGPHPDGLPYTDGEYEAFGDTSGQFALYPYARQAVTDITTRLALPPLVLGMLRIDLTTEDAD